MRQIGHVFMVFGLSTPIVVLAQWASKELGLSWWVQFIVALWFGLALIALSNRTAPKPNL